ncbi:MAG TPA: Holliday junction branch migration protein RuvA [Lachnospiraceae bacterium]|nr:Holliday junction branch migration protein RuvA [Lachnospiraceae bacterium]
MIGYLKGEVAGIYEEQIVLEVGGIGYNVKMSASTLDCLHGIGEEVKIYTYLSVREDAMQLYGFLTKDDLDFFKLLIQVNGIGPKGALAILSVMTTDDLRFAILAADSKTISKAPGIGAKTAQRLIIDLKDKVSLEDAFEERLAHTKAKGEQESPEMSARNEAVEALAALGYSATDALRAVKQVEFSEGMDVEDILKLALKKISR